MKYLLFPFCFLLLVCACKKDKNNTDPAVDTPVDIVINGISDLTIGPHGSGALSLQISGDQKTVTLSVGGLPQTATAQFSAASGTPTFSTTLTISDAGTAAGTYPVTISGKSGSTVKAYDLNLHVRTCVGEVIGTKSGSDQCTSDDYIYTATVTKITEARVEIRNMGGFGNDVTAYADLDCMAGTLTMPLQTMGVHKIQGTGTFNSGKINITYTVTDVYGETDQCTAVLE